MWLVLFYMFEGGIWKAGLVGHWHFCWVSRGCGFGLQVLIILITMNWESWIFLDFEQEKGKAKDQTIVWEDHKTKADCWFFHFQFRRLCLLWFGLFLFWVLIFPLDFAKFQKTCQGVFLKVFQQLIYVFSFLPITTNRILSFHILKRGIDSAKSLFVTNYLLGMILCAILLEVLNLSSSRMCLLLGNSC